MKLALLAALGAAGALAACNEVYPARPPPGPGPYAAAAPRDRVGPPLPPDACFYTRFIRNHTIGDDRTLYIRLDRGDVYRVGMSGACLAGAMSTDPIILREHGTDRVCAPIDLDISISTGGRGFATPCLVNSIERLTPGEVAALPPRVRP